MSRHTHRSGCSATSRRAGSVGPEQDGFQFVERKGSQRVYHHQDGRFIVVHYHRANDTLPPYVIRNLLTGTRWSEADLRRLKLIK